MLTAVIAYHLLTSATLLLLMRVLSALIIGEQPSRHTITFPTSLVVRASCGAHPINQKGD